MEFQGQYIDNSVVGQINSMLDEEPTISRRKLSGRVCEFLDWRSDSGKLKDADCRKMLLELDRRGQIALAECRRRYAFQDRTSHHDEDPAGGVQIACHLGELGSVEVVPVSSRYTKASRAWNVLIEKHHYLGRPRLRGAQIRYQVRNEEGKWLGALSFSSSTWRLKDRDTRIQWSEKARRANLQYVVCNSRFLILPGVRVPNLASHVLGLAISRIGDDWEARYGLRPVLLETFVDPTRFIGTCYRAANWIKIGKTSGRTYKIGQEGVKKDILIYPLSENWQEILCKEPQVPFASKRRPASFDDWAEEEFWAVDLDDTRLKKRLYTMARDFFGQPGALVPEACEGSIAKTTGAYRFFGNKQVNMKKLLDGHTESTVERIKSHDVVLAVQDSTTLKYTAHPSTKGLGPIGTKAQRGKGMIVHDTMAFTVHGTPLGLVDVQCWARDPKEAGKKHRRKQLPIEGKESMKWLTSYRSVARIGKLCPQTKLVSVGDRESDIYELFDEARKTPDGPDLLIRAERSRSRKVEDQYLWDRISHEEVSGYQMIEVPARPKKQPAREAKLEVRFAKVELKPPRSSKLAPLSLWAVHAREIEYAANVKSPLDWMILTTVEVTNFEEACERLAWYIQRWNIEIYHKILKSGCRIEDRWLDSAKKLEVSLAVDMVVGWRVHWLTKAARETPDVPCDIFFDSDEWRCLAAHSTKKIPSEPPPLKTAVRAVAKLGGFLGRKGDGDPGVTTVWRGIIKLEAMTIGFTAALAYYRQRDGP